MVAHAALMPALPAEPLLRDVRALGLGADQARVARAVAFAEGVAARGERDGLLVVHGHAREGHADVARRLERVGIAVGSFGVHVYEAHLDRGQRILERLALDDAGLGALADPVLLGAPIDVALGLVDVLAAAAEAEDRPAHRLDRDIAGQDQQVGPAQVAAIFLLDRPEETPRLVEVGVVGPGVERGEALIARIGAAAPVARAVGARGVPGHADEEGAVMTIVRWPPGLAVGHQRGQVALHRVIVELEEGLGIVEVVAIGVAGGAVLAEDLERKLVGPPVAVGAPQQRPQRRRLLAGIAQRAALGDCVHCRPLLLDLAGHARPPVTA